VYEIRRIFRRHQVSKASRRWVINIASIIFSFTI